jgi:hypothetical protein
VVEVVREPDTHASLDGGDERGPDDVGGLVVEADVVEREVEARPGAAEEVGDGGRDGERGLAAVRQQPEIEPLAFRG